MGSEMCIRDSHVAALAEAEGLDAHAESVRLRVAASVALEDGVESDARPDIDRG